jgi:hypothetical protein
LKKRSKKLSVLRALATPVPAPAGPKVFWLLFFKKVTTSFRARGALRYLLEKTAKKANYSVWHLATSEGEFSFHGLQSRR